MNFNLQFFGGRGAGAGTGNGAGGEEKPRRTGRAPRIGKSLEKPTTFNVDTSMEEKVRDGLQTSLVPYDAEDYGGKAQINSFKIAARDLRDDYISFMQLAEDIQSYRATGTNKAGGFSGEKAKEKYLNDLQKFYTRANLLQNKIYKSFDRVSKLERSGKAATHAEWEYEAKMHEASVMIDKIRKISRNLNEEARVHKKVLLDKSKTAASLPDYKRMKRK